MYSQKCEGGRPTPMACLVGKEPKAGAHFIEDPTQRLIY